MPFANAGFALFILVASMWGYFHPGTVAGGEDWIPELLAVVMLSMGLTITAEDLHGLRGVGRLLTAGVCLQYLVMPLSAYAIASLFSLPSDVAIGLIVVGACPGGTASNVMTFLARGDVALSVAMTTVSTLIAPLMTPLWIWLLAASWTPLNLLALMASTLKMVLLPVACGILIRRFWQPNQVILDTILPLISMAAICWIVAIIAGLNHDTIAQSGWSVPAAVIVLNAVGLTLGFLGARHIGAVKEHQRTIALEVGMQNSGLAVALSVLHFGPTASLPGALFSLWHNISGPLLASFWRRR